MNQWGYDDFVFNVTQIKELYGDTYNLSPRWNRFLSVYTANGTNSAGYYYFIDIEREKEIAIGTSWPYPDL